jgi:hypothetical protein
MTGSYLPKIPAALLACVALAQIGLTRAVQLTAWKGGGFGMFSTLDHGAFRGVDIVVEGPDRSEALEVPPSLEELEARAVSCPSAWLLRQLAVAVAERERRHGRPVTVVKLSVWRTEFDRATLHATERAATTFVYQAN